MAEPQRRITVARPAGRAKKSKAAGAAKPRSNKVRTRAELNGGKKDRNVVTALLRGIGVLETFAVKDVWLSNREISERTGLPKPTISRLTGTLTSLGYLRYSPRSRQYRLGTSVLALGYAVLTSSDIRQIARPYLQELADRFNTLVALGGQDRLDIIHLETCHSNSSMLTLRVDTGSRARLVNTAFGRALISALPDGQREALLEQAKSQYGARWPAIERELKQAFRQIERCGFCIVKGLWQPDINAVAVPLICPDGITLSIGCAGDSRRLTIDHLEREVGPALLKAAAEIVKDIKRRS